MAGGRVVGADAGAEPVRRWVFDSRLPFPTGGTCFLALPGGARRGTDFVPELLARGVGMFCVSAHDYDLLTKPTQAAAAYWIVEDVLAAAQSLAAATRSKLRHPVLAVTGSNGKTIVKEWTYALLRQLGAPAYRSPGSYNSQLGVALSLLHAERAPSIVEAGISAGGEMDALEAMIRPTVGILTNLGAAHDHGFDDRAHKLREKLSLFRRSRLLVYCADDPWLHRGVTEWREGLPSGPALLAWSTRDDVYPPPECRVRIARGTLEMQANGPGVLAKAVLAQAVLAKAPPSLPCVYADAASRQNLCHAVIGALSMLQQGAADIETETLRADLPRAIRDLPQEDMRLQAYAGRDGMRIIDDSYSADLEGFAAAAEFYSQHAAPGGPRVWIVGTHGGGDPRHDRELSAILDLARSVRVTRVIVIGPRPESELPGEVTSFPSVAACLASLDQLSLKHASVLVKGPRALRLDLIARHLREQSHELRLEISLGALAHNIAAYRARLAPKTKVCIMVKARAYGSGGAEVAAFFEQRGVDYLAVATVDEAVEIRAKGVGLPIIVAHVPPEEVGLVMSHGLEPEVSSLAQLMLYTGSAAGATVPLHLKVDTGMRRLGFDATEADGGGLGELLAALQAHPLRIASVFSHLSASDRPDADAFSRKQNDALLDAAARITRALGYRPLVHLLNSAGAWRLPELQHDMVRLGLGVYGLGLEAAAPGALEPAHRWVARLVQLRRVRAGDVVGYNLGGVAEVDRLIGVVNVGYADGLRRSAGHGAYALTVDGQRCPTVGSVCMDFTMVDLGNCPWAQVGDEVEVFGRDQGVGALASVYDTIAYEVFTGIGPRVRRVFYQ